MTRLEAIADILTAHARRRRVERARVVVLYSLLVVIVAALATDRLVLALLATMAFSFADMTAQSVLDVLRPRRAITVIRGRS